jgi:hypothetical protein
MTLVFLLSLHFLLMFGYMILIETGKSRLGYGHWLFALFLPFAGVLCLLTADFGRSPAANDYVRPFKQFDCAKLSEEGPEEAILPGTQITRKQLLDTIQRRPANLAAILTEALTSEDVEVVHIASSTIMKLQREYEKSLKIAEEAYRQMPDNMKNLKSYIEAMEAYLSADILKGNAVFSLLKEQKILIGEYLKVLPEDKAVGIISVKNSLRQGEPAAALETAERLRYRYLSDIALWELSLESCTSANDTEKRNEILADATKMAEYWTNTQKERWNKIQNGLKQ